MGHHCERTAGIDRPLAFCDCAALHLAEQAAEKGRRRAGVRRAVSRLIHFAKLDYNPNGFQSTQSQILNPHAQRSRLLQHTRMDTERFEPSEIRK